MNFVQKKVHAYLDLARIRISFMVVISCAIGYVLACKGALDATRFIFALIGTGLLSCGSCALNCYIERDLDALMPRTRCRPLPSGAISPGEALTYGCTLIAAGLILLAPVSSICAELGAAAVLIYLAIYTPLKRTTSWNTSVGAIPGAIPPMIGWAAAANSLDFGAWMLFLMLFVWQHTHFFPIAWLFRDDYRAAGFCMLPVVQGETKKTFVLTVLTAMLLMPLSLAMAAGVSPFAGRAYCLTSTVVTLLLVVASLSWWRTQSRSGAHRVLFLSLCYLPCLLVAVIVDLWT